MILEKRYHVYISSVFDDLKVERLKLEKVCMHLQAFSFGLNDHRNAVNNLIARRYIDESDYVIFLLGGRYGDQTISGISYMNLDLSYARSQKKRIIAFVDENPERSMPLDDSEEFKKLTHLKALLRKESHVYKSFSSTSDFERLVRSMMTYALETFPAIGWAHVDGTSILRVENTYEDEQKTLELQQLQKRILELETLIAQMPTSDMTAIHASSKGLKTNYEKKEQAIIYYRAEVYQKGNLKEMHLSTSLSWVDVFAQVAPFFTDANTEIYFLKAISQYVEHVALPEVKVILPDVHALSRIKIDEKSLQHIKLQMKWYNWITPVPAKSTQNRILWKMTAEGECLLRHCTISLLD